MINQIALTMISGVGNTLGRQLLEYFGTAEAVFKENLRSLEKVPGIGAKTAAEIKNPAVMTSAEAEYTFMEKNGIKGVFFTDEDFPYRLRECPDSPLLLYAKGDFNLNASRIISIVGTRNATSYGRDMTEKLISDLSSAYPDIVIVSGLAFGIDICSHKAALKNDLSTVGILAHGLDRIYPGAHRSTAVEMLQHGGLLTDYPSGTNPDKQNFVKRNRIVAGLSDATIVIESAERGGSLITADIAFSYSREVFAFPGKTTDSQSCGCNKLIRLNKAGLITSAADFIAAMGWEDLKPVPVQAELAFPEVDDNPVTSLIRSRKEIHVNDLSFELGLPISELSVLLFELEMDGRINALPGGRYKMT